MTSKLELIQLVFQLLKHWKLDNRFKFYYEIATGTNNQNLVFLTRQLITEVK